MHDGEALQPLLQMQKTSAPAALVISDPVDSFSFLTSKYLADVHYRRRLKIFWFSFSALATIFFCCFFGLAVFLAKYVLSATILLLQCQALQSGYC